MVVTRIAQQLVYSVVPLPLPDQAADPSSYAVIPLSILFASMVAGIVSTKVSLDIRVALGAAGLMTFMMLSRIASMPYPEWANWSSVAAFLPGFYLGARISLRPPANAENKTE